MALTDFDRQNLAHLLEGNGTNFTAKLLRLIMAADFNNKAKLYTAFPKEVEFIHQFHTGTPYEHPDTVSAATRLANASIAAVDHINAHHDRNALEPEDCPECAALSNELYDAQEAYRQSKDRASTWFDKLKARLDIPV